MIQRTILAGVLVLALGFFFVLPASAHGGEPRLEISLERLNPGAVVDVRGVDFEPEEIITLSVMGSSVEISLGSVTADVEGIFLQTVALPIDLSAGSYTFRAVTDDHEVRSPILIVSGAPVQVEVGEAQRDEGDSLLSPMPTYAPGVIPGGVVRAATPPPLAPVAPASGRNYFLFLLPAIAVGILALIGIRVARRR
jgi:hypothetical protein